MQFGLTNIFHYESDSIVCHERAIQENGVISYSNEALLVSVNEVLAF